MDKYAYFQFQIEGMTQAEADALWDEILDKVEAMGYDRSVSGTYKVVTNKDLEEIYYMEGTYEEDQD